ncbi:hypothetical protein [Anaerobium acetethylicum]|uniref:Uncharacterized protein n=1 Tax=Anaerobium acetethylicum TaxID=1619234 RepID=A0A1D3TWL5_9FIRM|nr:hypothetical protein [Anaerobium acetethylicum]SCP98644.1 hypothetical protein SAMN05421730_102358 [Anaerobium acetethylicum]
MKIIVQEYGSAILAVMTAMLVIGILFGLSVSDRNGILEIAGISAEKEEVDYTSYSDFDAVAAWHSRTKPEAAYIPAFGRFFAGEDVGFLERYYAKDMEGVIYLMDEVILAELFTNDMSGKILDIRKADGTSVMNAYSEADGSIHFPNAGVYEVYFQIRDRENLTSVWKIPIAVDERRGQL